MDTSTQAGLLQALCSLCYKICPRSLNMWRPHKRILNTLWCIPNSQLFINWPSDGFWRGLSASRTWTLLYPVSLNVLSPKTHCLETMHRLLTHSICNHSKQDGLLFISSFLVINSPEGIGSITPKESSQKHCAETSTKRPAVLKEHTDLCFSFSFFLSFFLWLACFGHSMMVQPGYFNKNAPICYAGLEE